jgi:GNAT superfamily N-acetyltransferase
MSEGVLSDRQFGEYRLRYLTADFGERKPRHIIEAFQGDTKVGEMHWYGTTGTLHHIDVEPEHSRRGIATAMWQMGQEARPRPKHSADRTTQGEAWAKKVGGRLPKRKG